MTPSKRLRLFELSRPENSRHGVLSLDVADRLGRLRIQWRPGKSWEAERARYRAYRLKLRPMRHAHTHREKK